MILPSTTYNRFLTLFVIALVLIAVGLSLAWCHGRDKLKEARGQQSMAEGRTKSAVEAITEIDKLGQRGAATSKEVEDAQNAIRNASPDQRDAVARARLACLQDSARC